MNGTKSSFEGSLRNYIYGVVEDFDLCLLYMSILSLLIDVFGSGDYYPFSCTFYLISLLIFLVLRKKSKYQDCFMKIFLILIPILPLTLIVIDDFVLSIKPLLYFSLLCFVVEIIRVSVLFKKYLDKVLKKQNEYRLVASFENRNSLLGKVSRQLLHDIATPVSILSGTSDLLERKFIDKREYEELRGNLKIAVSQIDAILHSTDFLMRRNSCNEYFQFNECIDQVLLLLKSRISGGNILVEVNYNTDEMIYGDRNIFLRVFLNIFLNAVEELEKKARKIRKITIKTIQTPKCIHIDVCDNGDGLDFSKRVLLNKKDFIISKKNMDMGCGLVFVKYCMKEVFDGSLRVSYNKEKHENVVRLSFPRS